MTCLQTRYGKGAAAIRRHLPKENIDQYGKVRRLDGGDMMHASLLVHSPEDGRDTTFVRVCPFTTPTLFSKLIDK